MLAAVLMAAALWMLFFFLSSDGYVVEGGRYFVVDVAGERFIIYVTERETIRLAEENMRGLNSMFPIGELEYGDGGFNKPWSWHLNSESVRMVEVAVEVCDGLPSHVEADLKYWVEVVGRYCPWGGRIVASADSVEELLGQASIK